MQEGSFWEGVDLNGLEELRLRLRRLVPVLDKKKRKIVYTAFQDEVMGVREGEVVDMPKMTGAQYEKKVKGYLRNHLDHLVIRRLRTNQPLTAADLKGLESALVEIGEEDGETLLSSLLARSEAPSLAHFVRSLVGLDRSAAQSAYAAHGFDSVRRICKLSGGSPRNRSRARRNPRNSSVNRDIGLGNQVLVEEVFNGQ